MNLQQMRERRTQLLREADGLRQGDSFANDEARAAFDAKMREIDALDVQIRAAETPAQPPAVPSAEQVREMRETAIREERERTAGIQRAVRAAGLDDDFAQRFIAGGQSLAETRTAILDELATRQDRRPTHSQTRITPGEDARDKYMRGAGAWLIQRGGMADLVRQAEGLKPQDLEPGEFRGMTLLDLCKDDLSRHRIDYRGHTGMDVAGLFFRSAYQTTSDFANLLENTMHRVLRAAYAVTPDTWSRWCGRGTVSDFRTHNWYRLGSLTELEALTEHGEFRNKAVPDAEKATYSVATKGNIVAISRQTIVNDDLGGLMRLTSQLGRAAKLTIEKAVYTQLGLNSGLGPTQSDSQPLFHANRANVNATGSAISMAGLDADATVMAIQTDVNGQDILDLRPSVLLVARGLEGTARSINEAEYDPDTTGKLQKPNIVRGMFADVVGTGRLSGTRRYLFADPGMAPVFLVSFLEGQQEPIIETQNGWRVDGVEMKARLDFGVDVVDFRGAVTNAGA